MVQTFMVCLTFCAFSCLGHSKGDEGTPVVERTIHTIVLQTLLSFYTKNKAKYVEVGCNRHSKPHTLWASYISQCKEGKMTPKRCSS